MNLGVASNWEALNIEQVFHHYQGEESRLDEDIILGLANRHEYGQTACDKLKREREIER